MTTIYKTFAGELPNVTGAYGNGQYDLSSLPTTFPPLTSTPIVRKWGYHVCRRENLVHHLSDIIAVVECDPKGVVWHSDQGATCDELTVASIFERWTSQVARLFAADCAAAVLHLTDDDQMRKAVRIVREFALGRVNEQLAAAAQIVASAAAAAASFTATDPAVAASKNAARAMTKAAAITATWDALRSPKRKVRTEAMAGYAAVTARATFAASAATAAASMAAAAVAWDEEAAAGSTRRSTRWREAKDAVRKTQTDLLFAWLEGRRTPEDVAKEMESDD
jgi:hypothetical protein